MLKNYWTVAWRNLWRNKAFSLINIAGLALGLACSFLILLWTQDESSFDKFHSDRDQLYTIIQRTYAGNKMGIGYYTPGMLASELKKQLLNVRYAVSYSTWGNLRTFQVGDKIIKENGEYAGEDFFQVFSFKLLQGDKASALNDVSSIAISRKMANSFFGSPEAAIGHSLKFENKRNFTISAVFEDIPFNSSLQFDYLINWKYFTETNDWVRDWSFVAPYTTVSLDTKTDPAAFKNKITHFLDDLNTKQGPDYRVELDMQRFDEMYLHGAFKDKHIGGGRIEYVRIFNVIAVFILLIACINFMNLTTARSAKRAKEIGVRKTAGARKYALVAQFIGEAILYALLAVVISIGLLIISLPAFNQVCGKDIQIPYGSAGFWLELIGIALLTGLIAGSYPALFLSSFNPIKVLKGSIRFGTGTTLFRKSLVVFQFVLSLILIISTVIIARQVKFIQEANLGFDRDNLISMPLEGDLAKQYLLFKQQAVTMPGIEDVAQISQAPIHTDNYWVNDINWKDKNPHEKTAFALIYTGYDFTRTMHLQIEQGRDFSRNYPTDSSGYIVNESAVKIMGLKDPVGSTFSCLGKTGQIIGVVKDFHFNSLHQPISPLVIAFSELEGNTILVRTNPGKDREAVASLETLCHKLNPEFPFTFQFTDESYQKLYKSEEMTGKLSYLFSFLAIVISCLGLLGLVTFTAEQRTKEIAIRKVLGAGIPRLFTLLSADFFKLVFIAFAIAAPLSWWTMNKWLDGYAYRTEISWWIFVLAGFLAMLITLVTVSAQVLKAARREPVKSLKTE